MVLQHAGVPAGHAVAGDPQQPAVRVEVQPGQQLAGRDRRRDVLAAAEPERRRRRAR